MKNIILIKYGELTTKKDNRHFFINTLSNNIKEKLKKYDINLIKEHSRMYIEFDSIYKDEIISVLQKTFGILEFNLAYKVNTNIESIKSEILNKMSELDFNTFKVVTKRRDKSFEIHSMDFNNIIGGYILKNIKNVSVDVRKPDVFLNIEINKDDTFFYFNSIKGLGGYPVGVLGKGLLMLSGGIDSPVSFYLALKRGVKVDAIYFEAIPHTSLNAREKVITLAKKLSSYSPKFNLYIASITKLQEEIYKKVDPSYMITILRRMMYRISEKVARLNKHLILINGESIGQVASQTLTSMNAINNVVDIPVIRPVACFDKLEIIDIAKKIDTYETSILPYEDCCTIFVPKHPVINPKLDKCLLEEEKLIDYEKMIDEVIENIIKIKIDNKDEYSDIF